MIEQKTEQKTATSSNVVPIHKGFTSPKKPAKPAVKTTGKAKTAKKPVTKKLPKKKPAAAKPEPLTAVPKRTLNSKTIKSLKLKLRSHRIPGKCCVATCTRPPTTVRALWCREHKQEIRTEQLRLNNIVWSKNVEANKAGHHLVYRGRPTKWSATNKEKALKLAEKGMGIHEPEKLKSILAKAPKKTA